MEVKTDGIVLKRFRKGEQDDLCVIFTKKAGKALVTAKSSRRLSSKLKPVLEPCSLNSYCLYKGSESSGYYRLTQGKPLKMFEKIRQDLHRITFYYTAAELTDKFMEVEDTDEGVFEDLLEVLALAEEGEELPPLEAYFKIKLLQSAGFSVRDNRAYIASSAAGPGVEKFSRAIDAGAKAGSQGLSRAEIKEMNRFLDYYIMSVLGEEIKSFGLKRSHA